MADLRIRIILVLVGVHLLERFSYICLRGSFQYSWDTFSSEVTIILNTDMLCKRFVISVTTSIKIRKRFFYLSNVFLHHNACEGRNLRMRVGRKSIKMIKIKMFSCLSFPLLDKHLQTHTVTGPGLP